MKVHLIKKQTIEDYIKNKLWSLDLELGFNFNNLPRYTIINTNDDVAVSVGFDSSTALLNYQAV